ncbi:MAG: hypothetical protein ACI30N_07935 [Muribaculaceae bacterium]
MKVIIADPDSSSLPCAPDSAVIASGTPFFCPDEPGADLHCRLLAGAVIERLGKNIQPRFAGRYHSRTVLLMQTVAACDDSVTAILRDGSITAGREPVGNGDEIALELTVGNEPAVAIKAGPEMPDLDAAIARASHYATLRTGDIVAVPLGAEFDVRAATRADLTATGPSGRLLHFKVR